jgi:hypothetical protein
MQFCVDRISALLLSVGIEARSPPSRKRDHCSHSKLGLMMIAKMITAAVHIPPTCQKPLTYKSLRYKIVALPAPLTPMRQVRTPGRKAPETSVRSTSCGRPTPSTRSPSPCKPNNLIFSRPTLSNISPPLCKPNDVIFKSLALHKIIMVGSLS